MKAARFSQFGGPEVLEIVDLPDPHPGPGQVRIAVRAAGVNPSDWKKRKGLMDGGLPQTMGHEAAGVVDGLGEGVADVAVDAGLRASLPGVYAVGDCAAFESRRFGRRLRFEHWDVALHAPEVVAANVLGGDEAYDPVPYFWSEQFGHMVQYAGYHGDAERLIWRGDPAGPAWVACWLSGGRLVAILTVNRPRDLQQGRRLIASAAPVDVALLSDPAIPVKEAPA